MKEKNTKRAIVKSVVLFVVLLLGTVQAVENQNPIDGSTVAPGDVELSWTNLDQAVSVDVYFTNDKSVLEFGTVEELQPIKIISEGVDVNSVIVRARPSTQYYSQQKIFLLRWQRLFLPSMGRWMLIQLSWC